MLEPCLTLEIVVSKMFFAYMKLKNFGSCINAHLVFHSHFGVKILEISGIHRQYASECDNSCKMSLGKKCIEKLKGRIIGEIMD